MGKVGVWGGRGGEVGVWRVGVSVCVEGVGVSVCVEGIVVYARTLPPAAESLPHPPAPSSTLAPSSHSMMLPSRDPLGTPRGHVTTEDTSLQGKRHYSDPM